MILLIVLTVLTLVCILPMAYAFYHHTLRENITELHMPVVPTCAELLQMTMILFLTHILTVTLLSGVLLHSTHILTVLGSSLTLSLVTLQIYRRHIPALIQMFKVTEVRNHLKKLLKNRIVALVCVLFIIQIAVSATRIIIAPPNVFDTQVYHLAIPLTWLHDGFIKLADDVPVERLNYATKLSKSLSYWYLRFGGPMSGVEVSQIPALILLLTSAYSLLLSLKTNKEWSLIGTILVASIPIIVIETTTLQDHILMTAIHVTFISFFLQIIDKRINPRMSFFALALTSALLLASKFSAPAHVAILWGTCFVLYAKECLRIIQKSSWPYLLAGVASLFGLGSIWYLANYLHYGGFFGPKHAQSAQQNIFIKNILDIPLRFFDNGFRYTPDLIGLSGFGPHVAMFGIVGTIGALFSTENRRKVSLLVASTCVLLGVYFTQYYTLYNYRLFIFVPVILVIVSTSYLSKQSKLIHTLLAILIPLGMVYTIIMTVYPDYHVEPLRVYRDLMMHYPNSRTAVRFDYASDKFKRDPSWLFIDQSIPESEPILYITQNEGVGYDDNVLVPYFGRDLNRRVFWGGNITSSKFVTPSGYPTAELIPYMRENGIHYLHNNSVFYYDPIEFKLDGTPFVRLTQRLYYLP